MNTASMASPSKAGSSRRSPTDQRFPIPVQIPEGHTAPSIISSRMTDIASEEGDEYRPEGAATARSTGGRTNERPQSAISGNTRPSTRATPSRRGAGFGGGINAWRHGGAFGGPGGAFSNTSRPQSATSKASRTHVPALASQAFYRPMSSQRLQAQRSGRFNTTERPLGNTDGASISTSNVQRHSLGSTVTDRREQPSGETLPPSRGTVYSDQEDVFTMNASPTGNNTIASIGESERPLQNEASTTQPRRLDVIGSSKRSPKSQKSPRSFRASFLMSAKGDSPPRKELQGHQRLSSTTESSQAGQHHHRRETSQGATKGRPGINYQYFSGNTVFCWGGRLQNARDRPMNIATALFVIIPSILFFIFSAPWLSNNVSPAIPVFYAYILFICTSSLIHASVTNPGILPRNLHPLPTPPSPSVDPLALAPATTEWTMVKSAMLPTAAMDVPTKYCKTCNIWRPPRTHHCRVCDNCIETQDHHCLWINNCVGRRNYRYFLTFVCSAGFLALFLSFASLGHCLRDASSRHISFGKDIADHNRVAFAMFIYGLLAFPYPFSLWIYHLVLMGRGETTREYLNSHKFLKKDRHRPYDQGPFWRNWLVVTLRPRTPTYLHFREEYIAGDTRFGPRREKRTKPLVEGEQGGGSGGVGVELQEVAVMREGVGNGNGKKGEGSGFKGPVALRGG